MKHFSTEEWADFVNRTASKTNLRKMQTHLDSGCKSCSKTLVFWQKVKTTAARETGYQVPAELLAAANSAFATAGYRRRPKLNEVLAQLVFDSFATPAMAGVRSSVSSSRHLLYRSERYEIDILIEARPQSTLSVAGQLLGTAKLGTILNNLPLSLSNRRGRVVQTSTNEFGEFQGELEDDGELEIRIAGGGAPETVVSLNDALGRYAGGKQGEWF